MRLWCALITCAAALATRFAVSGTARHGGGGLKLPPVWSPHRLTATALQTYVDKTFGPYQRCLTVASEDTAEAIAIVATLHRRESSLTVSSHRYAAARTIVLDETGRSGNCLAYVVIGRQLPLVMEYMENFRNAVKAERMLAIVIQERNYIKPFIKYSPAYFNYRDIILINVCPQKETVYQMSIYYGKFVPISKQQDQWFKHDLGGKQRVKNFYGTRIKLLVYNYSLFSSVVKDDQTGKLSLSYGIECDIFKEIATRLNVTWDVYTSSDTDIWGTLLPNKSVTGGALNFLHTRQVDVSFCSLWIERSKFQVVDMSKFWTLMCLKFLVPKPQPLLEKWDLLVQPFPWTVWLLLVSSAVLTTIVARALAAVQKRIGYERVNAFTSWSSTVFWIIGMILLTNIPRTRQMGPIKHLINWWCIFVFIISVSFSSTLYSYITSPMYTDIVLEIEDMLRADYRWGVTYSPPFNTILNMQDPTHRAFSEKFMLERTVEDRVNRLKLGKYAVLVKCVCEKHFMETEQVPATLLNDLRTSRTCLSQFYVGFGFVKRSPYVRSVDLVIQRIFESGLIDYWLRRVSEVHISPATFERVYEIKPRNDNTAGPSPLSYTQFKVVATVWMVGCALSAIVFVAELRYACSRTRVAHAHCNTCTTGRRSTTDG